MPSISRASVNIFRFLQKNYCILKLHAKSRTTNKKIQIADGAKNLRGILPQRGGSPNARALALHARGTEINAPNLQHLRPCVILIRFLKKNYCILKFHSKSRPSAKNVKEATELKTHAIILNNVDEAQMVERALRMREFRGAMPRIS